MHDRLELTTRSVFSYAFPMRPSGGRDGRRGPQPSRPADIEITSHTSAPDAAVFAARPRTSHFIRVQLVAHPRSIYNSRCVRLHHSKHHLFSLGHASQLHGSLFLRNWSNIRPRSAEPDTTTCPLCSSLKWLRGLRCMSLLQLVQGREEINRWAHIREQPAVLRVADQPE